MAMTQSPKLYLICALLALSVDLMKGFIDLCSTQPEREHQYFLNMPTFNLVSKCNFISNCFKCNAQLKYLVLR